MAASESPASPAESALAKSDHQVAGHGGADLVFVPAPRRTAAARKERVCTAKERISRMQPCAAGKRSSIYRGVTRHRWTGRYEAHLWDKSTWNQTQNKKGKQVYLGAYDDEEAAARAYDLAALKYWGAGTIINFPVSDYTRDLEEMQMVSKEEYLVSLRRKSSAFSKGSLKYRGLTRHPHNPRWDTQLGQFADHGGGFINLGCSAENYAVGFGLGRKIDLTGHIKWWLPKKGHQSESAKAEDAAEELRALESSMLPMEPYKFPYLGRPGNPKPCKPGLSACGILSTSEAFRNFLEKYSKSPDVPECSKAAPPCVPLVSEGDQNTSMTSASAQVQNVPFAPILVNSVPMEHNWNADDATGDPFWSAFIMSSHQSFALPTPPPAVGDHSALDKEQSGNMLV